jgi:prophage antirepressor-like protein
MNNKFKCDKCRNVFTSEQTLQTHKNKYHCNIKIDLQNTNEILEESLDLISLNKNILKFNNNSIKYFIHDNKIYFKAKDVANILKYIDTKDAIKKHVLNQDKLLVSYLRGGFLPPLEEKNINILKNEYPQTIFINESGLYSLILSSKMSEAAKFKHWITSDVLPTLRQKGEYKLNNINENILENTIDENIIEYDNNDDTEINDYVNKDCVYIIKIKDDIYKFGYSSKLDIRLSTHKNKLDYEKKIRIYILDNINQAIKLEKQLKYFFRKNNMLIKYENQKEIFQTDDIDNVIEKIDKFAESIKNKNIDNYNDVQEEDTITEKYNDELKLELEKEKEKTKQIISNNNVLLEKEKTKQLELEIEFYKLKNK